MHRVLSGLHTLACVFTLTTRDCPNPTLLISLVKETLILHQTFQSSRPTDLVHDLVRLLLSSNGSSSQIRINAAFDRRVIQRAQSNKKNRQHEVFDRQ